MKHVANFRSLIFFGLSAAFIVIRFWGLTGSCLWFDEIFGVHAATQPFGSLLSFVARDLIHPPLFYILLKLWIMIGGESLLWLRLLPVVFSIVALVPFFLLCRELKLKWQAIAAALFLIAVNGSLIKYSQEVRMYSLLLCISLFSIWLFARFLNRGKNIWLLTAVNVLLVYTHYAGWFVVAAEVTAVLLMQRIKIVQIAKMAGIVLVSFLPWVYAICNSGSIKAIEQNIGWVERPGLRVLGRFVLALVEPFYQAASSVDVYSVYKVSVPVAVLVVGAMAVYLLSREENREEQMNIKLLAVLIIVPAVLSFLISWLSPFSIWGTRHLIIVFVPFLILCATAVTELSGLVRTTVLTLLVLFAVYGFAIQVGRERPEHIWCAWEGMAKELGAGDVYVFEDLVAYHVWFATRGTEINVTKINGTGVKEDPAYFLPRGFDGVRTATVEEVEEPEIWVLFRAEKWDIVEPPLSGFLSRGYTIEERKMREADGMKAFLVKLKKEAAK